MKRHKHYFPATVFFLFSESVVLKGRDKVARTLDEEAEELGSKYGSATP